MQEAKVTEVWAYLDGRGKMPSNPDAYHEAIGTVCSQYPISETHAFRLLDWLGGDAVQFMPLAVARLLRSESVWRRVGLYADRVAALPPTYEGIMVMGLVLLARPSPEVWRALATALSNYDRHALPSEALLGLVKAARFAGPEIVGACKRLVQLGFPIGPLVTSVPAMWDTLLPQLPSDPVLATDICAWVVSASPRLPKRATWRRAVLAHISACPDPELLRQAQEVLGKGKAGQRRGQ